MIIQDFRIIKQIRDQFATSNYLLDCIKSISKISKTGLSGDIFINEIPITYYLEKELIDLNRDVFKSYKQLINKITASIIDFLPSESKANSSDDLKKELSAHETKRRGAMSLSFNISQKTNSKFCQELFNYFETIVPKMLIEEKLNKELNLKSDFSTLLLESDASKREFGIIERVDKSLQINSTPTYPRPNPLDLIETEEIDTDYPYENYSSEIYMQVADSKFHDSPRKAQSPLFC